MNNDYDYEHIGKEIKRIREFKKISQKHLADMTGMSIESIRRIENNYNNPRIDSLIDILNALEIDFDIILMTNEGSSWEKVDNIIKQLDLYFENVDYSKLKEGIQKLISFRGTLPKSYEIKLNQYIYYYKAIYEKQVTRNHSKYKNYLIEALKVKYGDDYLKENREPSEIDSRILINLSECYINIGEKDKSKEVFDYLLEHININDTNYINFLYNLARYYYMCMDYNKCLEICDKSLVLSSIRNDFRRIILLYYLKGLSLYQINDKNYEIELNKSLALCDLMLKDNLKKEIENSIHNIIDN